MRTIFFILTIPLCSSCVTYERCAEKYGDKTKTDTIYSVKEKVVPVEVMLPADTIETIIDCSGIRAQYEHQIQNSRKGYLQTEQNIRSDGKVSVKTRIITQYIHDTLRLRDTVTTLTTQTVIAQPNTIWKWATAVMGILILLAAICIFAVTKIKR